MRRTERGDERWDGAGMSPKSLGEIRPWETYPRSEVFCSPSLVWGATGGILVYCCSKW